MGRELGAKDGIVGFWGAALAEPQFRRPDRTNMALRIADRAMRRRGLEWGVLFAWL